MASTNWSAVYVLNDAESAYNQFLSLFTDLYDYHFPFITRTSGKARNNQPWMSQGIINSCNYKHKLYKRYLRNPISTNERKYKDFRKRLTTNIRAAKKNFYAHRLDVNKH